MLFWRKQLTSSWARENLPVQQCSVNELRARRSDPPRGRVVRGQSQVASLPSRPSFSMAKSFDRPSRATARLEGYVYRRPLSGRELIPAIGAGVVTGLAAFYVARLFLERTPLLPEDRRMGRRHASGAGRRPLG
jgi:hypothetical protein